MDNTGAWVPESHVVLGGGGSQKVVDLLVGYLGVG